LQLSVDGISWTELRLYDSAYVISLGVFVERLRQSRPNSPMEPELGKEPGFACPGSMLSVEQILKDLRTLDDGKVSIWEFHQGVRNAITHV